jgi:hypothetical protein
VAGAADSTGFREAGGTDADVPDAGAAGGDGAAGLAGADGTWIESSRHSQAPRAGSSRRGVNAAGASGASAGREACADADAAAGAGAAAGLALGGSVAGR